MTSSAGLSQPTTAPLDGGPSDATPTPTDDADSDDDGPTEEQIAKGCLQTLMHDSIGGNFCFDGLGLRGKDGEGTVGLGDIGTIPPSQPTRPCVKTGVVYSKVELGQPEVEGGLPAALVHRLIDLHQNDLSGCHTLRFPARSRRVSRATLHLSIAADGTMTAASIAKSTFKGYEIEACITQRALSWTFPSSEHGQATQVIVPFVVNRHMECRRRAQQTYR